MQEVELAGVGYGTLESVPIYHLVPGGTVLRLLVKTGHALELDCDWAEICWIDRLSSTGGVKFNAKRLSSLLDFTLKNMKTDALLIDGIDVLCSSTALDTAFIKPKVDIELSIRAQGIAGQCLESFERLALSHVSHVLFDYVAPISARIPDLSYRQLLLLENLLDKVKYIEIITYINDVKYEYLIPLIELLKALDKRSTPIHVIIRDYSMGIGIRELKRELSKTLEYFYIHAGIYSELDTYCPKCETPIASRAPGILRAINAKGGRCPICGNSIPFRKLIYNRTPSHIVSVTRGETKWYHPAEKVPPGYSY